MYLTHIEKKDINSTAEVCMYQMEKFLSAALVYDISPSVLHSCGCIRVTGPELPLRLRLASFPSLGILSHT